MSYTLEFPIQYFPDPTQFGTLGLGSLYVGIVNGSPYLVPAQRQQVYVAVQGGPDVPVAQPIALSAGGVPLYNGSPCTLKILDEYSIAVVDYLGAQVFYSPHSGEEIGLFDDIVTRLDNIEDNEQEIINTWSAISGVTVNSAGQLFQLRQHTSGGLGGGTLMSFSGSVADDNVTQKNALGGFYLKRVNYPFLTFAMAGAIGDGATDDTAAINYALAKQQYVDGEGKVYGVAGDITLPATWNIKNAEFKQLSANDPNRRTISATSSTFGRLENVTVNRNGNGLGGGLASAAGIWLSGCNNVKLKNCEVYGNDYGNGIAAIDCTNTLIDNAYVHDIRAGDASAAVITDDKVQAIWVQRGSNVIVREPRISSMRCQWSGQAPTPRFTRGLSIGGVNGCDVYTPNIYSVDQCIDISGDEFPTKVRIFGGYLSEGATFGLKCANSPTYVEAVGVIAEKCGASGFIISAPGSVLTTMTSNITFRGCHALATGFNTGGAAATKVGFRITNSGVAMNYPQNIKFVDCIADHSGLGLMQFGFSNDVVMSQFNKPNQTIRCKSIGHTTAAMSGFTTSADGYIAGRYYGGGCINPSSTTPLILAANTLYAIPFRVTADQTFSEMAFVVQAGAAGGARLGIYSWSDGIPSKLLKDLGSTSVSTSGTKSVALNEYLEPGVYALTIVSDVTPSIYCSGANIQSMEAIGTTPGTATVQISRALAYGALPADFGAVTYSAANLPNLFLRA